MTKDLNPVMDAFLPFAEFSKVVLDGYIVIDSKGQIFKSNPEAAAITGASSKQLLKVTSLDDVIKISIGDKRLLVEELLMRVFKTIT
jgi:PAS domain S-box-containing protein